MHATDLAPMVGRLTDFLRGWLAGPRDYFDWPDAPCVMSAHRRYKIGAVERHQWIECMRGAHKEVETPTDLYAPLVQALSRMADAIRKS